MKTKVEIYQVRRDIDERHNISFMWYAYTLKVIPDFKQNFRKYYDKKYEYEDDFKGHTKNEILDQLFYKFNMNCPEDFKGHSLSVSDIVILDDSNIYYCDSYGWQEV